MMELGFVPRSFELLEELADHNEKAWYDNHRQGFEAHLRKPFGRVLELASEHLSETQVSLSGGPKTMFRQHRDIRFSQDKSPYSTHVSGVLTPSGTKAEKEGLVYVHFDCSGGFLACGFYQLKAAELAPIRDRILEESAEFSGLLRSLDQAGLCLSNENKLIAMPRGYAEYEEHPHADYLKLKSFIVRLELSREIWLTGDIVDCIVEYAQNCAALLAFGHAAKSAEALR
ncbi:MAG: TIGR02453 family protein [Cyanobacteria bacterium P01_H01_bin.119]